MLDLDLVAFNSLYMSVLRVHSQRMDEWLWVLYAGSQGDQKSVKKMSKAYCKIGQTEKEVKGDLSQLVRDFGGGF